MKVASIGCHHSDSRVPDVSASSITESEPLFGYSKVFAPWARKRYPLSLNGLHEEIVDLYHWLRPSEIETKMRLQVFEKVKRVIEDRWSELDGLRVSIFGSLRTQLFLPTSDIDVLVQYDGWKDVPVDVMQFTAEAFTAKEDIFSTILTLTDTPVPIIKVKDRESLINIDISFNTVQGVKAAEYIEKVKGEFPVMEPLVLILKQFLSHRRLNLTYNGGLSSYGLILLLQHFLQTYYGHLRCLPINSPNVNLGVLLMRFLEVFAFEFNYNDLSINVKERRCDVKKVANNNLSIEDPLLSGNDVGRCTYNMQQVRQAFERALVSLRAVFVGDRPGSSIWQVRYPGSMLGHLLPYSIHDINYRCWLKGYALKLKTDDVDSSAHVDSMDTMLAPGLDRNVLQNTLTSFRKPLSIVAPDDAEKTTPETNTVTKGGSSPNQGRVDQGPVGTSEPVQGRRSDQNCAVAVEVELSMSSEVSSFAAALTDALTEAEGAAPLTRSMSESAEPTETQESVSSRCASTGATSPLTIAAAVTNTSTTTSSTSTQSLDSEDAGPSFQSRTTSPPPCPPELLESYPPETVAEPEPVSDQTNLATSVETTQEDENGQRIIRQLLGQIALEPRTPSSNSVAPSGSEPVSTHNLLPPNSSVCASRSASTGFDITQLIARGLERRSHRTSAESQSEESTQVVEPLPPNRQDTGKLSSLSVTLDEQTESALSDDELSSRMSTSSCGTSSTKAVVGRKMGTPSPRSAANERAQRRVSESTSTRSSTRATSSNDMFRDPGVRHLGTMVIQEGQPRRWIERSGRQISANNSGRTASGHMARGDAWTRGRRGNQENEGGNTTQAVPRPQPQGGRRLETRPRNAPAPTTYRAGRAPSGTQDQSRPTSAATRATPETEAPRLISFEKSVSSQGTSSRPPSNVSKSASSASGSFKEMKPSSRPNTSSENTRLETAGRPRRGGHTGGSDTQQYSQRTVSTSSESSSTVTRHSRQYTSSDTKNTSRGKSGRSFRGKERRRGYGTEQGSTSTK